jgi:hypothetical protein
MLTEQNIKKYQGVCLQEFGKSISKKEASRQFQQLILFVDTVQKNHYKIK